MQCEEWADANSELFKEAHDETVHKNSYKRKLYELISASQGKRYYNLRLQGATTNLSPEGAVKPEKPEKPEKPKNLQNPHAERPVI